MACTPEQQQVAVLYASQLLEAGKPIRPDVVAQLNECAQLSGNQGPAQDVLTKAAATPQFTPTPTGTQVDSKGKPIANLGSSTPMPTQTPPLTETQTQIAQKANQTGTPTPIPTPYNGVAVPNNTPTNTPPAASAQPSASPTQIPTPFNQTPVPTNNPTPAAAQGQGSWTTILNDLQQNATPTSQPGDSTYHEQYMPPAMNGGIPADILAGHTGGAQGGSLGIDAPRTDLMPFITGDPNSWQAQAGFGAEDMGLLNPYNDDQRLQALDAYAGVAGHPEWWKSQIDPFAQSLPGLYGLSNPGQSQMTATEYQNAFGKLDTEFNTPGSYVDPRTLWDQGLFGGQGVPGTTQDIGSMDPDMQIGVVHDALASLSPYLSPQSVNGLQQQMAQAAIDWKNETMAGTTNLDYISYLQQVKGADNWL